MNWTLKDYDLANKRIKKEAITTNNSSRVIEYDTYVTQRNKKTEVVRIGSHSFDSATIKVGIDPDVSKSGVFIRGIERQEAHGCDLSFFPLLELLSSLKEAGKYITVYISAGWLISKTNWNRRMVYQRENSRLGVNERIAERIGRNHQVGKLLVEYCVENNVRYLECIPPGKCDAGYFKKLTGYVKRTNQEQRDAGVLVY